MAIWLVTHSCVCSSSWVDGAASVGLLSLLSFWVGAVFAALRNEKADVGAEETGGTELVG